MIIVDRFEGDYVILEIEGERKEILRCEIPKEVKEGDVLLERDGQYQYDEEETLKRRQYIESLTQDLWKNL
ncbi:MAG: DUF3006 domain-containing protein [Epulopiscium sp.]|nr:DUF3006 domain-containing protein [Candidatus Epulonipiscium sp.]